MNQLNKLLDIIKSYDEEVRPFNTTYTDIHGKEKPTIGGTRGQKSTRYGIYETFKKASLDDKLITCIELAKMALQRSENPVVSCSYGIDSILTLWIVRSALRELGRDPSSVQVVWNNTLNEFKEVRDFQKWIAEEWNLDAVITKPKMPLMKVIEQHGEGGKVTADYFTAKKGDRKFKKRPLSEKCCHHLKHEPMKRARKENKWDLIFVGTRGDESSQRKIAGLRDGDFFYSKREWNSLVCKPIQWIVDDEVWEIVYKHNIPHVEIYEKNLIQKYPPNVKEAISGKEDQLVKFGVDLDALLEEQLSTIKDRRAANILKRSGFKLFTPRVGCQMCPIPVKYGYLQWMREYYPKTYDAMIHKLGYGPALISLLPDEVKDELEEYVGFELTSDNVSEVLEELLDYKPCTFDNLDTNKKMSNDLKTEGR